MMNKLFTGLFFLLSTLSFAQPMEVLRTKTVERSTPVRHIFIDADNVKWVLNNTNLYQVLSADFGDRQETQGLQRALSGFAGGNLVNSWPVDQIAQLLKGVKPNDITAGFYQTSTKTMWIGTVDKGVFKVKVDGTPQLAGTMTSKNSKLRTDEINFIKIDNRNTIWIGSTGGLLMGKGGKWKLVNKDYDIKGLATFGKRTVFVGDEWLWTSDNNSSWDAMELRPQLAEGDLVDVAFDSQGRLWIASEIIARYDETNDKFDLFSGPENFTSQYVNCITIDQADALWVGTQDKGLFLIDRKSAITVTCKIDQPLGCGGKNTNASLKVIVSGGQSPYKYEWSSAMNGPNPGNLGPGEYTVTVTDQNGKSGSSAITIKDNKMSLQVTQEQEESGDGNEDGIAEVAIKGGAGGYRFKWDSGETTARATQLAQGNHSVSVTDAENCTLVGKVDITRKIGELGIAIEQTAEIKCGTDKDAILAAKVSGGKGPYQFAWSNETTEKTNSNLGRGRYELTVTDAFGQTAVASYKVDGPDPIKVSAVMDDPATEKKGGRAFVKTKGGTGKFTIKWDNGETKSGAKELSAGMHEVTVTDAAGCTGVASVNIGEDVLGLVLSIEQTTEIKCQGDNGGGLKVSTQGGKRPFEFQWSAPGQTSEEATQLTAGKYEVTVTDASGQTAVANANIKDAPALSLTAEVQQSATTDSKDGKAIAKANGGAGKYNYRWDSGETKATAKELAPGNHEVTVTDQSGCTATATVEIGEEVLSLQVSLEQTNEIKCNGAKDASLAATAKGGKGPFKYSWNAGNSKSEIAKGLAAGNYEVTITDATGQTATASAAIKEPTVLSATADVDASATTNNKDGRASVKAKGGSGKYTYRWDSGESKASAKELGPGKHTVTVTDQSGCTAQTDVEITEDILPLQVSIEQEAEIKCQGNSEAVLFAKVKGGKSPFKYQWSGNNKSGEKLSGLTAGTYEVTVTDASGLAINAKITVEEPKALDATASVKAAASTNNKDGRGAVEVKGGTGAYTYKWDTGETTSTASKLGPGKHVVTVSDANACQTTASLEISEDVIPLSVTIQREKTNKCFGENIAALKVDISGGKAPFKYVWSDPSLSGESVSNLKGGNYSLTVTDASGQKTVGNVDVTAPEELKIEITKQRPATNERMADGQLVLNVTGGKKGYVINWDNERTGESNSRLRSGAHTVTVTDANKCQQVLNFEIETRIIPSLTANQLRKGQTVKLERLNFDADSTNLNASAYPILQELFLFLGDNPGVVIEVGGHTNNIPEHEFCDRLSSARAKSVADYIVQQGIEANRVYYKGYGKRKPIATNRTKEGRLKNQRVEIKILRVNPG